jgi:hypothetical protein
MAARRQRPEVKAQARAYMAAWREAKRQGDGDSREEAQAEMDFVSHAVEKQTDV